MFGLRVEELLVILLILVLLFGGKKIPELSRSIGQALKELRKGITGSLTDDEGEKKKAVTHGKKKTSQKNLS